MSEVIIFVDDLIPCDLNYVTDNICEAISKISKEKKEDIKTIVINGENMQGIRIAHALPLLKGVIGRKIDFCKDTIIGICIDLVDRRTVDRQQGGIFDGEVLLEAVKKDVDVQPYDVVVYTGKHVEVDEQRLKNKGAKGLVRREIVRGAEKTYELMAKQILQLLEQ